MDGVICVVICSVFPANNPTSISIIPTVECNVRQNYAIFVQKMEHHVAVYSALKTSHTRDIVYYAAPWRLLFVDTGNFRSQYRARQIMFLKMVIVDVVPNCSN